MLKQDKALNIGCGFPGVEGIGHGQGVDEKDGCWIVFFLEGDEWKV